MTHEMLWGVLSAQQSNAALAGSTLRTAAEDLIEIQRELGATLASFDAAGERLIGAALVISDGQLPTSDPTTRMSEGSICLLVGGHVAGPVGVERAARLASSAGAGSVHVAMLDLWTWSLAGVDRVHQIGALANSQVA